MVHTDLCFVIGYRTSCTIGDYHMHSTRGSSMDDSIRSHVRAMCATTRLDQYPTGIGLYRYFNIIDRYGEYIDFLDDFENGHFDDVMSYVLTWDYTEYDGLLYNLRNELRNTTIKKIEDILYENRI